MKITKKHLKRIINEEIKRSLSEKIIPSSLEDTIIQHGERDYLLDPDMASKIQNVFDEHGMPYDIMLGDEKVSNWSSALYGVEFAILEIDSESTARNLIKLLGAKVPGFDSYIFKLDDNLDDAWGVIARNPSKSHPAGGRSGYMSFKDIDDGKEINWKKM